MAFLQKLFLARYSIFAGAILFLLPIVVIQIGIFGPLLAGLFDLDGFWEMFWAAFFAYLLALSVFVTYRISSTYGPLRCGFADFATVNKYASGPVPKLLFAIALLLPVPMILNAIWLVPSLRQVAGAATGFIAALLVAFMVDFGQRLFNTFQGESPDSTKHLLLPFSYPFSSWAEKRDFASKVFSRPAFSRFAERIQNSNPKYWIGMINRDSDPAYIQPGIVLGFMLFLAFLAIYAVGFFLWIVPFRNESLMLELGITTMSYFLVLITLLCWALVGITFYADRFRIPSVILLLVILIFSRADHTYVVHQNQTSNLSPSTPHAIMQLRRNDRYIILVAANGGGIQSSAWTAEVLTRIDEQCREIDPDPNGCRNAIALISGVSGGSVGTMYFVDGYGTTSDQNAMNDIARRSAATSSLAYVGGGLAFNDAMRNVPLVNWVLDTGMDRGTYLERGWIRNRKQAQCTYLQNRDLPCDSDPDFVVPTHIDQTVAQWGDRLSEVRRPAVIFNATTVESGKRLLFSSARFETPPGSSADWQTFNQLFGDTSDIDVAEAVRLSASFPFVTPAAAQPGGEGEKSDHVVDGGYFDNYGLMSVRDFIADSLKTDPFDGSAKPKVLIIQIYGDEVVRGSDGKPKPDQAREINQNRWGFFSWYQQTFAPLSTMLNVRQTSQYTRNLEAYNQIVQMLEGKADVDYFVFKFFKRKNGAVSQNNANSNTAAPQPNNTEDYESPPLSWHLTKKDQDAIDQVSCAMRNADPKRDENTANWARLMDAIRSPAATKDWTPCKHE